MIEGPINAGEVFQYIPVEGRPPPPDRVKTPALVFGRTYDCNTDTISIIFKFAADVNDGYFEVIPIEDFRQRFVRMNDGRN